MAQRKKLLQDSSNNKISNIELDKIVEKLPYIKDQYQSLNLLTFTAKQGQAFAQYRLANDGPIEEREYWLTMSATQGLPEAQYALGARCWDNYRNLQGALYWLGEADKHNDSLVSGVCLPRFFQSGNRKVLEKAFKEYKAAREMPEQDEGANKSVLKR